MKTTQQWLSEYGESHRNATNKLIHWICVPAIMFSLIGLLAAIPSTPLASLFPTSWAPFVHWGTVFLAVALLFYARLSWVMFVGMAFLAAAITWGIAQLRQSSVLPLWALSLIIFAVAWVGQFVGHTIEGKKPSFLKDLQFLLIGPAWLLSFLYQRWGIRY